MYGDTTVMRKRVSQLRDQGADIRAAADHLVGQADGVSWSGRAADAMRTRVRERAAQLRDVAGRHEGAADALEQHLHAVDDRVDTIARLERKASALIAEDRALAADFTPPPTGHRDWLSVELPGL